MNRLTLINAVLVTVAIAIACPSVCAAETVALVGGTIIDGSGNAPIENGAVLIRDGVIAAVGPEAQVPLPGDAEVIDVRGRSVLPGLADMHVHLLGGWDGENVDMLGYRRYLNALLFAGVTTVLDTGNVMPYIVQMRNEIAADRLTGPRIHAVGHLVDSLDPVWPPISVSMASASQAPGIVSQLKAGGVDAIKAYVGLSAPLLAVLVQEAQKQSLPVIADVWHRNGSYDMAATGVTAFAHVPNRALEPAALELIQQNGIAFITTLATKESFARRRLENLEFLEYPVLRDVQPPAFEQALREYAARELTEEEQATIDRRRSMFEMSLRNVATLKASGVLIVAGTDAPYPGVFYGEGIHRELELLVEAGLTPLEAISAATRNAARLMKAEDWGELVPGKRADLLVVAGRPDLRIGDTRNVELVMQHGRIIDRAALTFDPATDPGFSAGAGVAQGVVP